MLSEQSRLISLRSYYLTSYGYLSFVRIDSTFYSRVLGFTCTSVITLSDYNIAFCPHFYKSEYYPNLLC